MKQGTKIFRLFGIDVFLHFSWWFIFLFLSWSLSTSFFPRFFPHYDTYTYWVMGVVAAVLLFVSVLLHELSHALVAKAKKIKVESITLFFFGGVAGIQREEIKPGSEFLMAMAGPLFSFLLGGIFYFIHSLNFNGIFTAISFYLYQINFTLGIFNLIPGFPLDGGRAFRAVLYAYYQDLRRATRIAATGGKIFAGILVVLGFISLYGGGGGIWFILLGAFLYFIAGASYEQVVLREALHHVPVKELLVTTATLSPEMSVEDFFRQYRSTFEKNAFLVKGPEFAGILDLNTASVLPLGKDTPLQKIAILLSVLPHLQVSDNAYTAFQRFGERNFELLPVMSNRKLVGFASRHRLMHWLSLETKWGISSFVVKAAEKHKK